MLFMISILIITFDASKRKSHFPAKKAAATHRYAFSVEVVDHGLTREQPDPRKDGISLPSDLAGSPPYR